LLPLKHAANKKRDPEQRVAFFWCKLELGVD
jgi:hypothetical protein